MPDPLGPTTPVRAPDPVADAIWNRVRDELRRRVDGFTYDIWLAPLTVGGLDERRLVLVAADERTRRWVTERFSRVLAAAAETVLGSDAVVEVTLPGGESAGTAPGDPAGSSRPAPRGEPAALNPKLRFDQFVMGECNQLAHAAALAVAELPGTAYNPLFIYGPPGVGKTHLLQSIATYIAEHSPGLAVHLTTAERFTNEFQAALHSGDTERFKDTYRTNDVLLIDDVQFLERKARTEEEFFHTFNALYDNGAQLVLTSDRTPRDLAALEERLRERFESGLVTDVRPPDPATRMSVLRKRAASDQLGPVPDDVLAAIADHAEHTVRALEGALIGVVAYASLRGRRLDVDLVRERLGGTTAEGARRRRARRGPPTVAEIQSAVGQRFGVTPDELVSASRTPRVTWPRQVAMHLVREEVGASLPAIGAAFGGRNHTTVLHALRRTRERITSDAEAREAVRSLTELLRTDRSD